MVFSVVAQCRFISGYQVLEESTLSIFRLE